MKKSPLDSLKKNKWFRIVWYAVPILCIYFITTACNNMFTKTNKQLESISEEIGNTNFIKIKLKDGKYVRTLFTRLDSTEKPTLILVHGAPGGVHGFKDFHKDSSLLKRYNILSYDRPGYGTRKEDYKSLPSLEKQADVLHQVVSQLNIKDIVFFSHSYGGAVVLEYSSIYSNVNGVFLAAVAVDPENEKMFWFSHFGRWKITRWMLGKALKTSADEKFSHVEELKKLKPKLPLVKTKVIIMHGNEDTIVPYENLAFLERTLVNSDVESITLDKENHFFPFKNPSIIYGKLLDF